MIPIKQPNERAWIPTPVPNVFQQELLQRPMGTVKMIRLDPGAAYPSHRHPDRTEYAWVVSGRVEITIGEDATSATAGEFLVFPVGVVHALANADETPAMLLVGALREMTDDWPVQ